MTGRARVSSDERRQKTGTNDAGCVVWALGEVFFLFFVFFILTKVFLLYIGIIYRLELRRCIGVPIDW
jgi:hypothetical protein